MALAKKKISEIPSDAVILSEDEALQYHSRILNRWKNSSDVFAYRYGSFLLGGATMLTGVYLNNFFRRKFKLLHYGRLSSYLPICAVPATLSIIVHQGLVVRDLILLKQEQCPICLELRASAIQSTVGVLMPLFLAPVSSIALVHKYGTYNMPFITKRPMEVFEILKKQIKSIKNPLFAIFIGQALLGSLVTYLEAKSIYQVNFRLLELERKIESSDKI